MHWQDLTAKVLPLAVSVITSYYSYKLNMAKSDRENARDQFDRLNAEVEKMKRERDEYYEKAKKQDQQILKLKKDLLMQHSEARQREAENDG
ncbi:hypothetical protein ACXO9E_04985 [Lactobacillus delbrueckii subsp. bulgaricus]|nr:hypothetical protein [Lactobacillus delbrueckii subsp. bulgaricus]